MEITNSILWDGGDEIWNNDLSDFTIAFSNVQDLYGSTDPLFIDPNGPDNIPGTEDDNLHLLPYSPCIDAGDPTGDYTNQTDIDGQQRVLYDRVDIGADEVFPIAGDIDQDGDVDFRDYAYFCGHWLKGK